MSNENNRNSLKNCLMDRKVAASVLVAAFVIVGLASPVIAQASSDAVLVMHFDEGSGSVAKDSSENGNDGTIYGATWTMGISGKALSFDGSNDYVDCGNDNSLKMGTNSFTLEAWIKTSTTKRMGIVGNYADKLVWILGVNDAGTVGMQSNTGDWNTGSVLSPKTMTDGDWHHLVGTREYGGKIKIYIDGIFEAERDDDSANHNVNRYVIIGDEGLGKSKYFNGVIDEVAIYNRALSPEEIKAHYDAKRAGYPTTALSLTKTASPYSIKQDQKTTVKITVENTGTTTIKDIEVVDTLPADFKFVSGDTSAKYGILKPRESRTFQYTLRSGDMGKFDLGQATATYADEEGNYHTVKSNSPLVEVMAPLEKPEIPTGEEGEKKGIPGFEAAFAIAGLLAVAYLVRRKKGK